MSPERFLRITGRYPSLHLAVVGDFCLDRYFDIDPTLQEVSIETGLPVHNVVGTRCQPGAAGTILNNLVALGVGTLWPVGVAGEDGEGWELLRALRRQPGVHADHFAQAAGRHTFTYSKPLLHHPGRPPEELSRLDTKNWTTTPDAVSAELVGHIDRLATRVDAMIVMDQVDRADTGVVTSPVRERVGRLATERPEVPVVADSRRSLRGFPPLVFKMNAAELGLFAGHPVTTDAEIHAAAADLARANGRPVFVTLAERGIVGAMPSGEVHHRPALPVRGPIDIVGAGDSVTANLTAALAAGATLPEAMELAMAAAHCVIHQLGTTGTAGVAQLQAVLFPD
ncbi:MAG: carbohydrate kinase [Verrucomicrobia bacterium]|nr:MAG: carbohydrate kinase [Verrucomicrobiota bacterium]